MMRVQRKDGAPLHIHLDDSQTVAIQKVEDPDIFIHAAGNYPQEQERHCHHLSMEIKNVEMIESLDRAISSYMNTCVNKLMVCVLCTLWMLEGPQTLIEATVGTPRFDRPI